MSIDGFRTLRATCLLAPNPAPMTLDGTNTWLIAEPGSPSVVVIDPGPDDEEHLRRVHAEAVAGDRRVARIVLTHGHLDHSAGAARLAELTGAPVQAADPARRLGPEGLADGDVITASGCELRVVAAPGHSADSVCLLLPADDALFTGDTVLGRGTTVSSAGAFAQAIGVQDEHGARRDLQPAARGEVGQRLVDCFPRGPDQLGQFLLRQVVMDVQAVPLLFAEPVGQVEQVLRHPAGHVGEDQVGHHVVGPPQPPG